MQSGETTGKRRRGRPSLACPRVEGNMTIAGRERHNEQDRMEEESDQLYRRPQMMAQAWYKEKNWYFGMLFTTRWLYVNVLSNCFHTMCAIEIFFSHQFELKPDFLFKK